MEDFKEKNQFFKQNLPENSKTVSYDYLSTKDKNFYIKNKKFSFIYEFDGIFTNYPSFVQDYLSYQYLKNLMIIYDRNNNGGPIIELKAPTFHKDELGNETLTSTRSKFCFGFDENNKIKTYFDFMLTHNSNPYLFDLKLLLNNKYPELASLGVLRPISPNFLFYLSAGLPKLLEDTYLNSKLIAKNKDLSSEIDVKCDRNNIRTSLGFGKRFNENSPFDEIFFQAGFLSNLDLFEYSLGAYTNNIFPTSGIKLGFLLNQNRENGINNTLGLIFSTNFGFESRIIMDYDYFGKYQGCLVHTLFTRKIGILSDLGFRIGGFFGQAQKNMYGISLEIVE